VAARIALIHAVRVAMDPIAAAFARGWPEAETVNLLDDGLSRDLERRGTLEGPMTERIGALAAYASGLGATRSSIPARRSARRSTGPAPAFRS
jgi:hypothetical protein